MNRVYVTNKSRRLFDVVANMVEHDHSVTVLSRGLRLVWQKREQGGYTFSASRVEKTMPSPTEIRILREQAKGIIDLSGEPAEFHETVYRNGKTGVWHGFMWFIHRTTINLNPERETATPLPGIAKEEVMPIQQNMFEPS